MRLLYPDRILAVGAESQSANYPSSNVRDNYPKHYWQATSQTSFLRLHVDSQSSGVAIANTNANQVDITIKQVVSGTSTTVSSGKLIDTGASFLTGSISAGDVVWNQTDETYSTVVSIDSDSQITLSSDIFTGATKEYSIEIGDLITKTTYDLGGIDSYYSLLTDSGTGAIRQALGFAVGYVYGYQYYKHNILIEFTASENVHAGVVRAGTTVEFQDPEYGLQEGLKDFSIIKELNNGAIYVRKRNVVKTYSGKIVVERDRKFYEFMREIIQLNGPLPIFWWVSTNLTNTDWIVFAKPEGLPTGNHAYFSHSEIDFNIQEVV